LYSYKSNVPIAIIEAGQQEFVGSGMKVSLEYSEILQNLFVFTSDSFIFS
jgi:type I site-specific restriction endonuclease